MGRKTPTFIEMTLQFIELTLLDTNLQVQHPVGWCSTHLHPFSGHAMRLLDGVRSARLDGAPQDDLDSDRDGQED